MKLIFMGTGPFAVPTFEAITRRCESGDDVVTMVVTRPIRGGKSRGGPPPAPVKQWASQRGLPIWDPPSINDDSSVQRLAAESADLMVVCDYGQILSPAALATTRLGGINLHGSLLPKYRGAAPVQWAVLSGDTVAGVSVLHMTPRLDGGPLLATESLRVTDDETAGELENRLATLGVDPTLKAIEMLRQWDGHDEIGVRQDPAAVTKAPRLSKSDGAIDWGRDAIEIHHHVRGMQPWPTAFTLFKPKSDQPPLRVAVRAIRVTDRPVGEETACGEIRFDDGLMVAAADHWVEVLEVQPAGKKPMSGSDMMRGYQPPSGSRFFS